MSTTNYPAARPLLDKDGKPIFNVTHADYVIDGVNRNNPKLFGDIYLNGIKVLSTQTDPGTQQPVIVPLDPSAGGTGCSSLSELSQKIATLLGYTSAGVVPITKGGTGATTAASALTALGAASVQLYQTSIDTTWSGNATDGYTKTVTISGMKATDVPVVGVVLSSDKSAALLQGKAFACINRITTASNSITLYAYNTRPNVAISIQMLVIRGF